MTTSYICSPSNSSVLRWRICVCAESHLQYFTFFIITNGMSRNPGSWSANFNLPIRDISVQTNNVPSHLQFKLWPSPVRSHGTPLARITLMHSYQLWPEEGRKWPSLFPLCPCTGSVEDSKEKAMGQREDRTQLASAAAVSFWWPLLVLHLMPVKYNCYHKHGRLALYECLNTKAFYHSTILRVGKACYQASFPP